MEASGPYTFVAGAPVALPRDYALEAFLERQCVMPFTELLFLPKLRKSIQEHMLWPQPPGPRDCTARVLIFHRLVNQPAQQQWRASEQLTREEGVGGGEADRERPTRDDAATRRDVAASEERSEHKAH